MQNYNYQRNYYAFVNGLDGARNYSILPNQTMMLMDNDNPVCFMKSADATGKTSLKCFKLVEVSEKELEKEKVDPQTQELRNEINAINSKIDELIKSIRKDGDKDA